MEEWKLPKWFDTEEAELLGKEKYWWELSEHQALLEQGQKALHSLIVSLCYGIMKPMALVNITLSN